MLCFRCAAPTGPAARRDARGRPLCAACWSSTNAKAAATASPTSSIASDLALEPQAADRTRAPCLKCGAALRVGVPACPSCGFDASSVPLQPAQARRVLGEFDADPDSSPQSRRRRRPRDAAPPPALPTCTHCKYNLSGVLPDSQGCTRCPECGHSNRLFLRNPKDELVSREVARATIRKPAIMLIAGLAGLTLFLFARGWWTGGATGAVFGPLAASGSTSSSLQTGLYSVGVGLAIWLGVTLVAFGVVMAAGWLWLGLDGKPSLTLLQVAGSMTVTACCVVFLGLLPLPIPPLIVYGLAGFMYAGFLTDLCEFYIQDATIVTVLTCACLVVPGVLVAAII